jgi:ribosomal protein S18 acetylase RimI-like enzyme
VFTYKILGESRKIIAGINCEIGGGWLYIVGLWVDDNFRGMGLGEKLLLASEDKAKEKGCQGACLFSYSSQAPKFYERNGYLAFAALEDFYPAHSKIFMKKRY